MHQGRLRDISYATTNGQEAVKTAARQVVAVIVVGAANSSNSQRLREVVEREGCSAQFIPAAEDIDWNSLEGAGGLGRTPPRGSWRSATRSHSSRRRRASESMAFPLPRGLREAATERG